MATQAKRDYYEILGIGRTAGKLEIKCAFQKLTSAFQAAGKPRNIDDVEEIRGIATAYRVLSDVEKREQYDRLGFFVPESHNGADNAKPIPRSTEGFWEAFRDVFGTVLEGFIDS